MTAELDFVDAGLVHVPASHSWISTKRFRFRGSGTDHDLLESLIGHQQYADHYAGQAVEEQTHASVHGPYELAAISVATFVRSTASIARARLTEWATGCAMNGEGTAPTELAHFLAYELPISLAQSAASFYELPDIRERAGHDWGWVVGSQGFHEFVAIDRDALQLTLIVASDD